MPDDVLDRIRCIMKGRVSKPRASNYACLEEWKDAVKIWASEKVSRNRVMVHAAALATEFDLRRPSEASLRDWVIKERRSIGALRPYHKAADEREMPLMGRSGKPTIFLVVNSKGGSRRSHTASLVYRALAEGGIPSPIAATLTPDDSSHAYPAGAVVRRFHLESGSEEEEWNSNLLNFWFRSLDSTEGLISAMVVDMPCRFDWESIIRLASDFYDPYEGEFDVVGVVPTLPDPANLRGAIDVLDRLQFRKWIHFSYDPPQESDALFREVRAHSPRAVVSPPEVSLRKAMAIRSLPVSRPSDDGGNGLIRRKQPASSYWKRVRPQVLSALESVLS